MRSFSLVLAASLVFGACSSDDDEPSSTAQPLPECPTLDTAPCDTRVASCQQRLLELAACMYGVERAPDVPIRVVTPEQLLAELQESADEPPADPDDAKNVIHVEQALVELRLLEPGNLTQGGGAAAELVDRIDGVYQDAESGIALVDRGRPKNDAETAAVLLHEFVHAIQDDRYDLALWREQRAQDVDSSLALRTVSEGQATYAQFRALFAMMGYDLARYDVSSALDEFRSRLLSSALDDASPYIASFTTFPYAIGVHAAERAWSATGLHYAERQFDAPPLSTLQALGDSYGLDLAQPSARSLTAPEVTDGYQLVDETRLGAFMFELFLHQYRVGAADARALSLDWNTDRLWVYAGPGDTTAYLWELELQGTDFETFSAKLDAPPAGVLREERGRRMFVVGSNAPPDFLLAAGRTFLDEPG